MPLSSSFRKIEANNFNSGSCFFNLVKVGMKSPASHFRNCVYVGKSQAIPVIIRGLSKFLLAEGFQNFYFDNLGRSHKEMFWKKGTEAYGTSPLLLHLYFAGWKNIFCFCFYKRAGWNFSLVNLIKRLHFIKCATVFSSYLKSIHSDLIATSHLLCHQNWLNASNW